MTGDNEGSVAEQLMKALIYKMEVMDSNLHVLKAENEVLKGMVVDPAALLKKAGFVSRKTVAPVDVMPDMFRVDSHYDIVKNDNGGGIEIPTSNQEFHEMNWDDIHQLAAEAKSAGALGNQTGIE